MKTFFTRFRHLICPPPELRRARRKRKLERKLQDLGLTRSQARRVIREQYDDR